MKKASLILLVLVFIFGNILPVCAESLVNTSLLEEYQKLLTGTWEAVNTDNTLIALNDEFTYDANSDKYILFVTSDDEIWFGWGTKDEGLNNRRLGWTGKIAFSADAKYLLIIGLANESGMYKRKE